MENEKSAVVNPQQDWAANISLEELKKTYRDSIYLVCIGNILHLFAAAVFLILLCEYLTLVCETRQGFYYGVCSIAGLFLLIFSLLLNKIKAAKWVRNVFYIVQGIFALFTLYCIFRAVCHSPLGNYCLHIFGQGNAPLKPSARVISDTLKFIAQCFVSCVVAETVAAVLQHDRSTGARIFLIPASLVWSAGGIMTMFGRFDTLIFTTVIFFFLMPMVFWIAVRNRNRLFSENALSHKQLSAVLGQKKKNMQGNEIVIPEDSSVISKKKTYLWTAWFCLAVSVLYLLYINIVQYCQA